MAAEMDGTGKHYQGVDATGLFSEFFDNGQAIRLTIEGTQDGNDAVIVDARVLGCAMSADDTFGPIQQHLHHGGAEAAAGSCNQYSDAGLHLWNPAGPGKLFHRLSILLIDIPQIISKFVYIAPPSHRPIPKEIASPLQPWQVWHSVAQHHHSLGFHPESALKNS